MAITYELCQYIHWVIKQITDILQFVIKMAKTDVLLAVGMQRQKSHTAQTPALLTRWQQSPLHWRHKDHDSVSNHQPPGCLFNRLFRRRSKKTSKLHVTGLCVEFTGTGEFPAQRASYAENVSIWWRHHALIPHWPRRKSKFWRQTYRPIII